MRSEHFCGSLKQYEGICGAASLYKTERDTKGGGSIRAEVELERIISEYQNLIFSICYKFTQNYFDAEDLTQETFLSVYKNYADFDGTNERAWICRIATNKSLDYLKRAGRRSIPTEDMYFSSLADETGSLEEDVLDREVRRKLWDCCNQLRSPYREAAIDYFYYEMDIGDMVKKTGKNIKTLQTQIYRAKGMLRTLYGREELPDATHS